MKIIVRISRFHLVKRVIAKLLVLVLPIKSIRQFFTKFDSRLGDVEGIFDFLNVERELENIYFINCVLKPYKIETIFDIGTNYGQFISQLNISKKIAFEPNTSLSSYIHKNNLGDNLILHNLGLTHKEGDFFYKINLINSGASSVIESSNCDNHSCLQKIPTITVRELISKYFDIFDSFSWKLIKIDIEGNELKILKEFSNPNYSIRNCIYAFETMSKANTQKIFSLFPYSKFLTCRFNYQGSKDQNYSSVFAFLKVFLMGRDSLHVFSLNKENIDRDFYSLIFVVPSEFNL